MCGNTTTWRRKILPLSIWRRIDWIVISFVIINRLRDVFPLFELAVLRPRRWERVASALLHPQPQIFTALPLNSRDLRSRLARKKEDIVIKSALDCGGESAEDMPGNLKRGRRATHRRISLHGFKMCQACHFRPAAAAVSG